MRILGLLQRTLSDGVVHALMKGVPTSGERVGLPDEGLRAVDQGLRLGGELSEGSPLQVGVSWVHPPLLLGAGVTQLHTLFHECLHLNIHTSRLLQSW